MKPVINQQLLPMKAHYFLWNAGTGPVTPYLSTYAKQLGFSSTVVGLIYTVLPISGMLAKPLFGSIADRFHCQKLLFLAAQLLTAAAFLSIFYSPKIETSRPVTLSCRNDHSVFISNSSDINNCSLTALQKENSWDTCQMSCGVNDPSVLCNLWNLNEYCQQNHSNILSFSALVPKHQTERVNNSLYFTIANITLHNGHILIPPCSNSTSFLSACSIICGDYAINDLIAETSVDDKDVYGFYQFWCVFIFMIVGWIGQAITVTIGDAICFELLGDKISHYGYQRLFGALGWGIIAVIAGVVIDASSKGKGQKDYTAAFYMAACFLVLDFLSSTQIKYSQKKVSTNILKDIALLLVNVRIIVFILWCICSGMCTGIMWNFQFWLIEDLAAAQDCSGMTYVKTLEGLVQGIQTILGETPFFFLSGRIMKKFTHVHTMSLILFTYGIRCISYSVISNPWYFLPIEVSNGLTSGLSFACMASYASIIAPSGTEATTQGLVGAVFEGVGVSSGSYLGGYLYKKYGGPLTFRIFGIGALIACITHIAVQYLLRGTKTSYSSPEETVEKIHRDDEKELTYLYT